MQFDSHSNLERFARARRDGACIVICRPVSSVENSAEARKVGEAPTRDYGDRCTPHVLELKKKALPRAGSRAASPLGCPSEPPSPFERFARARGLGFAAA